MKMHGCREALVAVMGTMALAACGGDGSFAGGVFGGGDGGDMPPKHKVGVTVSGLKGTGLTLTNNGGDSLSIPADGRFSFATQLARGAAYAVAVRTQPTPAPDSLHQHCTVESGGGTVGSADVSIEVICSSAAPRFVYVVNYGSNDISGYAIDSVTGTLTQMSGSPFRTGEAPTSMTVDPNGNYAYVPNVVGNTISEYAIEATSGALRPLNGSPIRVTPVADEYPLAPVRIDPSGTLAIVGNPNAPVTGDAQPDNLDIYRINANDGSLTPVPVSPVTTNDLFPDFVEIEPTGKFIYVLNSNRVGGTEGPSISSFALDPGAGTLTALRNSPFGHFQQFSGFRLAPTGRYGYIVPGAIPSLSAVQLLKLDEVTGAVTAGASTRFAGYLAAVTPNGSFMYVSDGLGFDGYGVDATSGTLTPISGMPVQVLSSPGIRTMVIDPSGRFLYMSTSDSIYAWSIDDAMGTVTSVPGSPFSVAGPPDTQAVGDLTIDPSGRFAFVTSPPNLAPTSSLHVLGIDPVTGALKSVPGSPFTTGSASQAIAFRY